MYYEARSHELLTVANAAEAVSLIHQGKVPHFQCPTWTNANGHRIALVDDTHVNCLDFGECAVVNLDTQRQLESITFAWIETEEKKLKCVTECETTEGYGKAIVPIGKEGKNLPAMFECSCCGTGFTSTLAEQEPHDQDCGFGFCPECDQSVISSLP